MSSSINWMDNKVVNPAPPRPTARMASPSTRPSMSGEDYMAQFTPMPQSMTPSATQSTPQSALQSTPQSTAQATPQPMDMMDDMMFQQGPPPATERGYIPYYLTSNLGKSVRAEFIIGTNQYVDKTGILNEVGINYFVLEDVGSRTHIMCDLYSVKFVTVLNPSQR